MDSDNVSEVVIGTNPEETQKFWKEFPPDGEDALRNPDIVHANNFFCPRGFREAKIVYTLYDMSFALYPEFTTEANRLVCFEGVLNASCYADFIVAISDYSRRTFLEIFPHYPGDRIRVVHLGSRFSSMDRARAKHAPRGLSPGGFWLSVGTLEPRKNLRRLLKAYASLVNQEEDRLPLVLAGGKGWLEEGLNEFIRQLGIEQNVKVLGYISDDVLRWLYENCFAFIYPSLFEGFGLPVLEALSLGAAVVTSNTTSLPEVGGNAVCYVDPLNEQYIATAMSRIMDDDGYRVHLKNLSKSQAEKFSWERCASEILDSYEEAMDLPNIGSIQTMGE